MLLALKYFVYLSPKYQMERYDYNLCQLKTVSFPKGDMPAQKCSQGLLLKFQDGTFGAIKFFREKIHRKFYRMSTGNFNVWFW